MRFLKFSHLLRLLIFSQLFASSFGFFFPLFGNFFNRFRNNHNGNHFSGGSNNNGNGGVSIFNTAASTNTGTGNVTSIRVPMLTSSPQRRVDIVTTVVSTAPIDDQHSSSSNSSSASLNPEGDKNATTVTKGEGEEKAQPRATVTVETKADQQLLSTIQRFTIPTSTSVTSSISAVHHGVPVLYDQGPLGTPNTLTLPLTPNMFGIMAYVQALKDIKRNYKDQEKERKIMFHNKDGGDLMTRVLRTLIQKVVNKYQKGTEILKLKILKRQGKLQKFLQLPMVSQVIAMDQARGLNNGILQPVALGNSGAGIVVPAATSATATHLAPLSRSGKPFQSILNSFLIR